MRFLLFSIAFSKLALFVQGINLAASILSQGIALGISLSPTSIYLYLSGTTTSLSTPFN